MMIKNSPLFDVDEAFRLFSPSRVEVVSLGDECKEVLISTSEHDTLAATAVGLGSVSVDLKSVEQQFCTSEFCEQRYRYLIIPDVALQKARLVSSVLGGEVDLWSNNGFGFSEELPHSILGRCFEVERIVDYSPKVLRRELSGRKIEILKRDFPLSTHQIVEQLKIKEGGECRVAFTQVRNRKLAIFLR